MTKGEVAQITAMTEAKFRKIAAESRATSVIQIQVLEISDGGWAILGPFGIFRDADGTTVYEDLGYVHALLRSWGVMRFLEAGEEKAFP